jgi:hypothetical protein
MINRILLSLLSIGMVADTVHATWKYNTSSDGTFNYHQGATGDRSTDKEYVPLFWPEDNSIDPSVADKARRAAFERTIKEMAQRGRNGAKEAVLPAFGNGALWGAKWGAPTGAITGFLVRAYYKVFRDPSAGNLSVKLKQSLPGAQDALYDTFIGAVSAGILCGLGNAFIEAWDGSKKGMLKHKPRVTDQDELNMYCDTADTFATQQLLNHLAAQEDTEHLRNIIIKHRAGKSLSTDEQNTLNDHNIAFEQNYFAIFHWDNASRRGFRNSKTVSLKDILQSFEKNDIRNRELMPHIIEGGKWGQEWASKHHIATSLFN